MKCFGRSLDETYRKLAGQMAQERTIAHVEGLCAKLEQTPPRLMDGVPETLEYLNARHRLILFTKGHAVGAGRKGGALRIAAFFRGDRDCA